MQYRGTPMGFLPRKRASHNQTLTDRVRDLLRRPDISERKMFGGLAFMLRGNMCCGINGSDLVIRVGPDAYAEALADPAARPMDFTGRPLRGLVYVGKKGYATDRDLASWIARAVRFAESLPAQFGDVT